MDGCAELAAVIFASIESRYAADHPCARPAAVVVAEPSSEHLQLTLASLGALGIDRIGLVLPSSESARNEGVTPSGTRVFPPGDLSEAVRQLSDGYQRDVLVAFSAVLVPPNLLDTYSAERLLTRPGVVSFPAIGDLDESEVTRATSQLRSACPGLRLSSTLEPAGPLHLLTASALTLSGDLIPTTGSSALSAIIDFARRARRHGFHSYIDHSSVTGQVAPVTTENRLSVAANAVLDGLHVIIDGRCLGPDEMGTQVHTLAVAVALSRHADVARLTLVTNGPLPEYARHLEHEPGVRHVVIDGADITPVGPADVLYRPYQADVALPIGQWRATASRFVIAMQDLIAYDIPDYAENIDAWHRYRDANARAVRGADGVVAISRDALAGIVREHPGVDPRRRFVVPCGVDHCIGDPSDELAPDSLGGWRDHRPRFLLVLGADFAHKNRPLAIRAWNLVRSRFPDVELVLAGPEVSYGSSRAEEELLTAPGVHRITGVGQGERRWLMRHAAAVLMPTSAEGFGLVPFEAARLGTPTVHVGFGPLSELSPGSPTAVAAWTPEAFAAECVYLLENEQHCAAAVAHTISAGSVLTWSTAAESLVEAFRTLLSLPTVDADGELERTRAELASVERQLSETEQRIDTIQQSRAYRVARLATRAVPRRRR